MDNDEARAAADGRYGRSGITAILLAFAVIATYGTGVIAVFLDGIQAHFGLDYAQLGLFLTLGTAGSLASLTLIGPLSQTLGLRRLLLISFGGVALAFLVLGLGRSLMLFCAGLLLLGIFRTSMSTCVPAYLVRIYPELKRRMLSVSLVSGSIPGIAYPLLAQYLLTTVTADRHDFAWVLHVPFLTCGVIVLLMPLSLRGVLPKTPVPADGKGTGRISWRAFTRPRALGLFLLLAVHASADGSLCSWYPKFMHAQQLPLPLSPGVVLSLMSVAYMLSRLGLAFLPEKYLQRLLLVVPGPLGAGLVLIGIWSGDPLLICVCYPLGAFFWSLEYPPLLSEMADRAGDHFASWLAAGFLMCALFQAAAVNLIAQIGQTTGDLRLGVSAAVLGFALFGLGSYLSGLGKR